MLYITITDASDCPPNTFRCNDGRCIDLSKLCNYRIDCESGEDELCGELCTRVIE